MVREPGLVQYSVQCTVYSVQCTVYIVHCTVYSVQCTVYIVQCSVQCTVYSAGDMRDEDSKVGRPETLTLCSDMSIPCTVLQCTVRYCTAFAALYGNAHKNFTAFCEFHFTPDFVLLFTIQI